MSLLDPIPSLVEELSGQALEWPRLQELVAGFAISGCAREWLRQMQPSTSMEWIAGEHGLIREMRMLLKETAPPAIVGLFDPESTIGRAAIPGATLEPEELRELLPLLDTIAAWQEFRPPEGLAAETAGVMALVSASSVGGTNGRVAALARSLRARLAPDGTLADDASPGLRRVRKEIDRQQLTIEEGLRKVARRLVEAGESQDEIITIRAERFVIPVKSEFKRRIPGVVHGTSSSGQTVYLEPLETIEQNNELVRLMEEEQAEIRRVLEAMTREIGGEGEAIAAGARALARLDTIAARARFAEEFDCVRPRFPSADAPSLELSEARHPLLEKRLRAEGYGGRVVPLTLALNDQARQLIISGPNTGGKTVALKTCGLLSMMAQAGIPVPAREAAFPLFHAFLADIGDAQSIEKNLSTFSAHVVNLNKIAERADGGSLVLLDELGASTDPEEGAALAVAFAKHFLDRRAWCLVSTHYTALKVYAAQNEGVLNAAVGFDSQTLAPTYDLRMGVPGISSGINIAERLGLAAPIAALARRQLDTQTQDISVFLDRLHEQLAAAEQERESLRLREQEVAREKNRLNAEGLKEWRAKVRDLEGQLQSLLKDFSYRIRESLAAIDDRAAQQKLSKEAERRMARLRREFSEQFDATVVAQHSGADKGDGASQPHVVREVSAGDTVKLKSLGKSGRVLRRMDGDAFEVAIGAMKMRVERADIAAVERATPPVAANPIAAAQKRGISVTLSRPEATRSEINVIGQTVEEAADEVDRFLDQAFLAGLAQVRIVHGMGMGVLRRAIRKQLEKHPHVAGVAEAGQAEGGAGATVVQLRP
ncbi:MAG TPA: endonuclease MutS2 [Acidobacteriaceae bacterium]|nr:endonuclease MutS2 [Acidobacteriaceae bacterium]